MNCCYSLRKWMSSHLQNLRIRRVFNQSEWTGRTIERLSLEEIVTNERKNRFEDEMNRSRNLETLFANRAFCLYSPFFCAFSCSLLHQFMGMVIHGGNKTARLQLLTYSLSADKPCQWNQSDKIHWHRSNSQEHWKWSSPTPKQKLIKNDRLRKDKFVKVLPWVKILSRHADDW